MPGKGQRVLTIREKVYNDVKERWEGKKKELAARYNVTTLTGYAQALIQRALKAEESESRFEIVNRFENRTLVRDYFLVKDAEVVIRSPGGSGRYATVYCELDRTGKCPHVGVVLSDPEVVERAKDYGLVLRRAPRSVPIDESLRNCEKAAKSGEGEVSEKRFADMAEKEGYEDEGEPKEMLRDLCASGDVRVTREAGDTYFFAKV